jgi:hypothetical protein
MRILVIPLPTITIINIYDEWVDCISSNKYFRDMCPLSFTLIEVRAAGVFISKEM